MSSGQTGGPRDDWPGSDAEQQSPGPPPAPPQRRGTNWAVVIGVSLAALLLLSGMVLVIVAVFTLASGGGQPLGGFGERVGVVTISGMISAAGEQPLFGPSVGGARQTMKQLRDAADDRSVKAVVLRINSPGGSPAASQEIYEEVKRLSEEKPVVVSMADVAASGGYYIAAAADRIVASRSTVTGSIGVRSPFLEYYKLMDEIGVDGGNLTTGRYKDTGSPWREMRPDEKKLLQSIIDGMHDQFIEAVAEGRDMEVEEVRELADGRIYTGEQALEHGLIDETGNFYRAVELAGELGGIEGEPKLKNMGGGAGILPWMSTKAEQLARRVAVEYMLYDERLTNVESMMRMLQ
ncbi:MAG: signal peptide peptidase SppA [Armatimonadota bacterium]